MPDVMSKHQRSELMSRIHGTNTAPEMKLRRALWVHGARYRLHYRIGRFTPDLVFVRAHIAVFVDGCFWHCCPVHGVMPKANRSFWRDKLEKNVQRDTETNEVLSALGWTVLRFWEHEIDGAVESCVRRVLAALNKRHPTSLR